MDSENGLFSDDSLEEKRYNFIAESDKNRLDKLLHERMKQLSRTHLKRLILEGNVLVNSGPSKPSKGIKAGDEIELILPPLMPSDIKSEPIPIDIIYEDEHLLVINKQKGITVHPVPNQSSGTLVNALMYYCKDSLSGISGINRPGIVHRLDKNTSGLLIVAKNDAAHIALSDMIKNRFVKKKYTAITHGIFAVNQGNIETLIGRNPRNRKKMAVVRNHGKDALTYYEVVEQFELFTIVDVDLLTGRTHQIRVHMNHIGHPIVADNIYGGLRLKSNKIQLDKRKLIQSEIDKFTGQALHARYLSFRHPITGDQLEFEAPLPDDMLGFIAFLRNGGDR